MALLAAGFALASPEFLSARNLSNIALQVAVLMIVSLGMTLVILTEGIDLSLGPVLGLCGVSWRDLVTAGSAADGARRGAGHRDGVRSRNGTLVAYVGMPPFIVTLGAFGIAQSLAMVLTQGNSVTGLPRQCAGSTRAASLGDAGADLATVAVFAVTWMLLYRTQFGRYVFAIGGNRRALSSSGSACASIRSRSTSTPACWPRSPPSS